MSYPALLELLGPLLGGGGVALWSRRMTLGPTPEFCLQGTASLEFPGGLPARRIALELLWGEGS
jgi:hypothetical protein